MRKTNGMCFFFSLIKVFFVFSFLFFFVSKCQSIIWPDHANVEQIQFLNLLRSSKTVGQGQKGSNFEFLIFNGSVVRQLWIIRTPLETSGNRPPRFPAGSQIFLLITAGQTLDFITDP